MKKKIQKNIPGEIRGISVAVDVLIFTVSDGQLKVLLIQIGSDIYKDMWAMPGGLVLEGESLDEAADRVLAEKAGVRGIYLEQLYTFGDPKRDKRGRSVSISYFALVSGEHFAPKTTEYYKDIRWMPVDRLPSMAFDHKEIIAYGTERLRSKIEYSNIAYGLLPREFTLSELQRVYERVLGRDLDKRNFRKKILLLDIIHTTGAMRRGEASRPAQLFSFRSRVPKSVQML